MLHFEALPDHTLALLRDLSSLLGDQDFYLAGGTALSLRLGHRVSVDLDFFTHTDIFTIIKSLTWFEDAETEPDPVVLQQQSWPKVKKVIRDAVSNL